MYALSMYTQVLQIPLEECANFTDCEQLHQLQQSTMWLVYCGEQVFSEVPVSECSGANEMGAELQPVPLNHNLPQPVCPRWPRDCECSLWDSLYNFKIVSLYLYVTVYYPTAECDSHS